MAQTETQTQHILSVKWISSRSKIATGIGCLIRDIDGTWVCGYAKVIEITTDIHSELKAIKYGLRLVVQKGFKNIKLESESALSLEYLSNPNPYNLERNLVCEDLVEIINNLWSKKFDVCEFVHTPNLNNAPAGAICNYAFNMHDSKSCSTRVMELHLPPTTNRIL